MAEGTTGVHVVGSRVLLWFLLEHQYFDGTINSINNGKHCARYDDNDIGTINIESE